MQLGAAALNALVDWATRDPEAAEAVLREVVWGVPVDARQLSLPLE